MGIDEGLKPEYKTTAAGSVSPITEFFVREGTSEFSDDSEPEPHAPNKAAVAIATALKRVRFISFPLETLLRVVEE